MSRNRAIFALMIVVAAIAIDYGRNYENLSGGPNERVGSAIDKTVNPTVEQGTGFFGWLGRLMDK